jgi:deoxyribose-phosphate aldolase
MSLQSTAQATLREAVERLLPAAQEAVAKAGGPSPARILPDQAGPPSQPSTAALAACIDHTLLKAGSTPDQIDRLCDEARRFRFAAVCVNPAFAGRAAEALDGSGVRTACVVGFPLGATSPEVKAFEAGHALRAGACEIDMVADLGSLRGGDHLQVAQDLLAVLHEVHAAGGLVKVILEMGLLTLDEKVVACLLAAHAGADFVKTSTGFGPGGATAEDVALMRFVVGPGIGVKAAGGVRTRGQALAMIAAGANRIGTSAGVQIVQEAEESQRAQARSQEGS